MVCVTFGRYLSQTIRHQSEAIKVLSYGMMIVAQAFRPEPEALFAVGFRLGHRS